MLGCVTLFRLGADANCANACGQPGYVKVYHEQLKELLTSYGPVFEVWFDGAMGGTGYYGGAREKRVVDRKTYYDYLSILEMIDELQPNAVVFSELGPGVRWGDSEGGVVGDPCWATFTPKYRGTQIPVKVDPATGRFADFPNGASAYTEAPRGHRDGMFWMPAEGNLPLRPGWFYHQSQDERVRNPWQLTHTYFMTVGRGGSLNVGLAPDKRGRMHDNDVTWKTTERFVGSTKETGRLKVPKQPVLNTSVSGDSICLLDGAAIVCLDRASGTVRWRAKPPAKDSELTVGTLIIHQGVVIFAEQGLLTAFSAEDGAQLWTREARQPGGLWFSWKDVFVIDGLVWTWGPTTGRLVSEVHGHDLRTGELKKKVPLGPIFKVDHHHRCYRNKATSRFIIASRRGAEFINLEGGPHSVNNWVRGICHLGMMPANGLLYAPPEPCKCYWYERVSDFVALAPGPVREPSFTNAERPAEPVPGPAAGHRDSDQAGPEDWPTFRSDPTRSGCSKTRLPESIEPVWKETIPGRPSAPIAVGDRVFVAAVDAHTVHALDAA